MPETTIDAAIEHLVRVDVSDRTALIEAARVLADALGCRLSAKPQHGDHGTCAVCNTRIHYSANWRNDGGWWSHAAERPADGHHAVLGAAA